MSKTLERLGRCPSDSTHGRLLNLPDGTYVCPHAAHASRAADDDPALRRSTWSIEELRRLEVMP